MRKEYKLLRSTLCVILILMLGCVSLSRAEGKKKYTIMMYVCGSDLERDHGQLSRNMASLMSTHYDQNEVNAIALLGGTPRWAGNAFDASVLNVVELAGRRPKKVCDFPLAPMSDGATLIQFLAYCRENYPAEHYILEICNHGGGPLYGCCIDELFSRDIMSVKSLREALGNSVFADGSLDIIAFNACLMASAEVAYSLAPYAKYMVATEDAMFGLGQSWVKDVEKDESLLETARRIAESTYQDNRQIIEQQHASELNSVSVIDLKAMQEVSDAMNAFFVSIPKLDEASFTRMSGRRGDAVDFGVMESGGNSQYDLVDIGSLVSSLEENTQSGEELLDAIRKAIPYNYADVENCMGMTVYHPFLNKEAAERFMDVYSSLGFAPAYVNYVINYASIMTGTPLANWQNLMLAVPPAEKDKRTLFTLTLTDEQAANLGDSQMDVLQKEADGSYRFTYLTTNTRFEDGRITGEYSGTALYAVDGEGNVLTKPLPYRLSSGGVYLIPAELKKIGEDGETVAQKTMVHCTLDTATRELIPGGISVWDETMRTWNSNFIAVFSDFEEAVIHLQTRNEERNADGVLLPFDKWKLAADEAWSAKIDGSWSFCLLNDTIDPKELYAAFRVQDSQANQYLSELHQISTDVPSPDELRVEYDDMNLLKIESLLISKPDQLTLSADLISLGATETVITLKDLTIDGEKIDTEVKVYGSGPDWGLLQGEKQVLSLSVPAEILAGKESITVMEFSLVLSTADESTELGTIPVKVTMAFDLTE